MTLKTRIIPCLDVKGACIARNGLAVRTSQNKDRPSLELGRLLK